MTNTAEDDTSKTRQLPLSRKSSTSTARASTHSSPGLYIGCGNGRNYLPLVDAGLNLYGLDVAPEALRVLARRRPAVSNHLICEDFAHFRSSIPFGYVIAIQVFQHGMAGDV